MIDQLTDLDKGVIRNMMLRYSHKDIALATGITIEAVSSYLISVVDGTMIVTKQMELDGKVKQSKPKKKTNKQIIKEWSKQKDEKRANSQERFEQERQRKVAARQESQAYKTKHVDLSKHRSVRIDDRTFILIKPDEDPEEAVSKFYKSRISQKDKETIY